MALSLEELRRLTREAVRRGWLDPGAAFDIALRCSQGLDEPERALASLLDPAQVAVLLREEAQAPRVTPNRPSAQDTWQDNPFPLSPKDAHATWGDSRTPHFAEPPARPVAPSAPRPRTKLSAHRPPTQAKPTPATPPSQSPRPATQAPAMPSHAQGRYQLESLLGQGGSGKVYLALDRAMRRRVALKVLRRAAAAVPARVARFLQEAQVAAQLEHPNIIPVYDWGVLPDGQTYYTMRVVKQRSLKEVLRLPHHDAGWPLSRRIEILAQLCRALEYVHARGVVHRDLKPANVLLGDYGEVYLSDWGIAKSSGLLDLASEIDSAESLDVGLGTPGYASPEQALGVPVDGRADLYAVGVMLYELLCQRRPYSGESVQAVLLAQAEAPPAPPEELRPESPPVLASLCRRLLQFSPDDRPESASEVTGALESIRRGLSRRVGLRRRRRVYTRREAITLQTTAFNPETTTLGDEED
jgi:serine/threonine protein kinase